MWTRPCALLVDLLMQARAQRRSNTTTGSYEGQHSKIKPHLPREQECELLLLKRVRRRREALLDAFPIVDPQRDTHRVRVLVLLQVQLVRLRRCECPRPASFLQSKFMATISLCCTMMQDAWRQSRYSRRSQMHEQRATTRSARLRMQD